MMLGLDAAGTQQSEGINKNKNLCFPRGGYSVSNNIERSDDKNVFL